MKLEEKIWLFIKNNHVSSISTLNSASLWAANLFYVFDSDGFCLFVMSDHSTRHVQEWTANDRVAGTISGQESNVSKLRGVQFTGTVKLLKGEEKKRAFRCYTRSFPIALAHSSPLWGISLDYVKFTDNTLGFGKKLTWTRQE
nr:pyridoxamine 5'-phosphate oxidase family protein [uncultured Cohaesibacter sp.]